MRIQKENQWFLTYNHTYIANDASLKITTWELNTVSSHFNTDQGSEKNTKAVAVVCGRVKVERVFSRVFVLMHFTLKRALLFRDFFSLLFRVFSCRYFCRSLLCCLFFNTIILYESIYRASLFNADRTSSGMKWRGGICFLHDFSFFIYSI